VPVAAGSDGCGQDSTRSEGRLHLVGESGITTSYVFGQDSTCSGSRLQLVGEWGIAAKKCLNSTRLL